MTTPNAPGPHPEVHRASEPMPVGLESGAPRLGWRWAVGLYADFAMGVVLVSWPLVVSPATLWPPHHDARVFTWVMASIGRRLLTSPLTLFHGNAFYPFGESLAYTEILLPPALLGLPGFVWGNPVRACPRRSPNGGPIPEGPVRPTAVLFDLGGVVCDFVPERRLAALAVRSGLSEAEVHARLWTSGLDARMDEGAYDLAAARQAVVEALGVPLPADELSALWALAFEPRPEVLDAVDAVRRFARTGLLTDNGPLLRAALPERLPDVARRFEWWLFSCDLGGVKPAPRLFAAAAARTGLPPEALLLVDDRPANVDGARKAGLSALLFRDAPTLRRELAP